jgi:sulfatase modifying factor 1
MAESDIGYTRREILSCLGVAVAAGLLNRSLGYAGDADGARYVPDMKDGVAHQAGRVQLVWCPSGRFLMGSPPNEPERRADEAQTEVRLTQGFWVGKYPVTQREWKQVMGSLPAGLTVGAGDNFPVYNVSYSDAEAFCRKLTAIERATGDWGEGWVFRLPTEAQWEYACRSGTKTATAFGDSLSSRQANFKGDFPYSGAEKGPTIGRTEKVGSYPANAWGIHDMHGNVYEWCRDWYHATLPGGTDPDLSSAKQSAARSVDGSVSRVRRGGSWADAGSACRSACRSRFEPERRSNQVGFRVIAMRVLR